MKTMTILAAALIATSTLVLLTNNLDDDQIAVAVRPSGSQSAEVNKNETRSQTGGINTRQNLYSHNPVGVQNNSGDSNDLSAQNVTSLNSVAVDAETFSRDPSAVIVANDLFKAIVKPMPKLVLPAPAVVVPVAAPAPPKPAFTILGLVIENGEQIAIVQNNENVSFVKSGDIIAGYLVEKVDERGMELLYQKTEQKLQLSSKALQ
jgi:hypothetical protein